jgi:hypothetical protein
MLTILPLARGCNAESSTLDHNVIAVVQHAQQLHYSGSWYRGSGWEVEREGGRERTSLRQLCRPDYGTMAVLTAVSDWLQRLLANDRHCLMIST